jgi:hypothetical protein
MATSVKEKKAPLLPPEEEFWERYSPHHEMPLAAMTSLFVHGLALGLLIGGGLLLLMWGARSESHRPPSMDVVQLSGPGDGNEGETGAQGLPGEANRNEAVPDPTTNVRENVPEVGDMKQPALAEIKIPEINHEAPKAPDVEGMLKVLEKDANSQAQKKLTPTPPAKKTATGTGNPKGVGGVGTTGKGLGSGTKGTGTGVGGIPGGRQATKAEIFAWRWRFDLTGNGKEHANKLSAFGVTLAFPTPDGRVLFIQDLRRRPVALLPGNMDKFKDAVKWRNSEASSMRDLARELQLPFVPTMVIMLLPRDREDKMAEEEMRFAKQNGRSMQQVSATWFDFQLRNGVYEPVAIKQQ